MRALESGEPADLVDHVTLRLRQTLSGHTTACASQQRLAQVNRYCRRRLAPAAALVETRKVVAERGAQVTAALEHLRHRHRAARVPLALPGRET